MSVCPSKYIHNLQASIVLLCEYEFWFALYLEMFKY